MATIKANKSKLTKIIQSVVSSTLYELELVNQPGLLLEDALVMSGEPIEHGEEEIENIVEEIMLSVEAALTQYEI